MRILAPLLLMLTVAGPAQAADYDFALADSVVVDLVAPLIAHEPTVIWTSAEVAQGTTYPNAKVYVQYEAFSPDTDVVSPFNFEVLAIMEQEQADGTWQEIGSQNLPIRKLNQGPTREILVSPTSEAEEGSDQVIAGFGGVPVRLKSVSRGSAEGTLRVVIYAVDYYPAGANPFDGITFSVTGQRFD